MAIDFILKKCDPYVPILFEKIEGTTFDFKSNSSRRYIRSMQEKFDSIVDSTFTSISYHTLTHYGVFYSSKHFSYQGASLNLSLYCSVFI